MNLLKKILLLAGIIVLSLCPTHATDQEQDQLLPLRKAFYCAVGTLKNADDKYHAKQWIEGLSRKDFDNMDSLYGVLMRGKTDDGHRPQLLLLFYTHSTIHKFRFTQDFLKVLRCMEEDKARLFFVNMWKLIESSRDFLIFRDFFCQLSPDERNFSSLLDLCQLNKIVIYEGGSLLNLSIIGEIKTNFSKLRLALKGEEPIKMADLKGIFAEPPRELAKPKPTEPRILEEPDDHWIVRPIIFYSSLLLLAYVLDQ
jgi:hypothetical protein